MGYDRHRQRSVRVTSDMVQWGIQVQPEQKSKQEGHVLCGAAPFGPHTPMAGWCQHARLPLGQHVGTLPVKQQGEGLGLHGGMSGSAERVVQGL